MNDSSLKFECLPFYPTSLHDKDWAIKTKNQKLAFSTFNFRRKRRQMLISEVVAKIIL